jgi:molybdate transport system substrate-binding protein
MQRRRFLACAAACGPTGVGASTALQRLTVAAASDLRFALDELLQPLRAAQRGRIDVVYGSSGKLATQIRHGAPFDVFLSADIDYARALHEAGLTTAAPPIVYAVGRLAAWSTDDALGRLPLELLVRDPRVRRFAIANPEHAPYGRRAMEALRHLGLEQTVQPKLIFGESVSQAAAFIETGAAQAGLVALSLLRGRGLAARGSFSPIPQDWHSRLEQALVVVRHAAASALAASFVSLLQSSAARELLLRYGFESPSVR